MNGLKFFLNSKRKFVTFFVVLSTFGLVPAVAHAVPQVITMSPTSVSPVIKPGETFTGSFLVLNQGETSYTFKTYPTLYRVSGEDYTPEFTLLPTAPNVASWLKFSAQGGYLTAGQSATINYTVSVPNNTPPGGYYAAAFAETQLPDKTNGVSVNERVGELFYIQVAGPAVKKGEFLSWQSGFFQKPPLTSYLRIKNDGSLHFPAKIQYQVKDILGHAKYTLNTDKELLPQTIRRITLPWNKTPSIGLFKVTGKVSFLDQNKTLPTKWVLVISQKVRLFTLAFILIVVLFLAVIRPRYHTKKRAKNSEEK